MIIRAKAKSDIAGPDNPVNPRMTGRIEFEEICSVCERSIPDGATVLRKIENNHIICLLCLVEIAEIAKSERT